MPNIVKFPVRTFDGKTVEHEIPFPLKPIMSFDSDGALAFVNSSLTYVEATIYNKVYPEIFYHELIPVNTVGGEHIDSISYRSYDGVTMAKFIGANADDLPKVATSASITVVPIGYGGNASEYSLNELRVSQWSQMPLDVTQADLAFRGYHEHCQKVAFFGDAERKMTGLFNNPNVTTTASGVDWSTVTIDNWQSVVNDMNDTLKGVWEQTKGAFTPDTLLLPATKFALVSGIRMNNGTDTSVMEWFKRNNFYTELTGRELTVRPVFQLDKIGTTGKGRMVAYRREPGCLEMFQPLPFRSLAPQMRGLLVTVPNEYKTSGTEFRQPMSAMYRDFK